MSGEQAPSFNYHFHLGAPQGGSGGTRKTDAPQKTEDIVFEVPPASGGTRKVRKYTSSKRCSEGHVCARGTLKRAATFVFGKVYRGTIEDPAGEPPLGDPHLCCAMTDPENDYAWAFSHDDINNELPGAWGNGGGTEANTLVVWTWFTNGQGWSFRPCFFGGKETTKTDCEPA